MPPNDDYLYSVKIDRKGFENIDFNSLERVDPIEAIGTFPIIRKTTSTGIFKAIKPFEIED